MKFEQSVMFIGRKLMYIEIENVNTLLVDINICLYIWCIILMEGNAHR